MSVQIHTPEDYLLQCPPDRIGTMQQLRNTIWQNLPSGYEETMSYGMIGYVVPHSLYPAGYHCNPKLPLPFISLASQKNFIGFYHMGLYADALLMEDFFGQWDNAKWGKPDMGKSCIRFKKMDKIPFDLIGELCKKMTATQWIAVYEKNFKSKS